MSVEFHINNDKVLQHSIIKLVDVQLYTIDYAAVSQVRPKITLKLTIL